jgi:hypothetical protein
MVTVAAPFHVNQAAAAAAVAHEGTLKPGNDPWIPVVETNQPRSINR